MEERLHSQNNNVTAEGLIVKNYNRTADERVDSKNYDVTAEERVNTQNNNVTAEGLTVLSICNWGQREGY